MWKRDEGVRPSTPAPEPAPAAAPSTPNVPAPSGPVTARPAQNERESVNIGNIGKSVVIKGELNGSEDLVIEGQVEGKIELRQNILTIGANGRIKAQIFAKQVIVQGEVIGNMTASEKIDIRENGSVEGDIVAPKVAIAEGAHFRGSIDMQKAGVKPGTAPGAGAASADAKAGDAKAGDTKPAPAAAPAPAQAPAAPATAGKV